MFKHKMSGSLGGSITMLG